jgi:hypothetical protein
MEEKLKNIEMRREKLYEVYKKEQRVGFIALFFLIISLAITVATDFTPLFVLVVVLFIVAMVFFAKAGVHANKFKDIIKGELIITLLEDQFENVRYSHTQSIPQNTIVQTGMVKRPDRFSGEDYISAVYKGVNVEVSDVELKERVETRDSKGNRTVTYQTYFKGRWYIYKFKRKFDGMIKIVEGRGFQMNTKGLIKVDTESIEFNKKFTMFSSSQQYAFFQITPRILEKLMDLEKLHRGSIFYYFNGNELHIGVNDGRDYLELPLKRAVNEEGLKDLRADIDLIAAIINELNLDSSKFNNTN